MFKALFRRNVNVDHAHALYGAVVARARDPEFYSSYHVPDTFDGRFEMLVMHLFLLHSRLKDEELQERKVSQLVFDDFIDDMDSALREAAVGDQTVPKRITKMTQVFYGRTGAFEEALEANEPHSALTDVIARNLFPEGAPEGAAESLAHYMRWQVSDLAAKSNAEIINKNEVFQGNLMKVEAYHG